MQTEVDAIIRETLEAYDDGAIEEGDLSAFGLALEQFHRAVADRHERTGCTSRRPKIRCRSCIRAKSKLPSRYAPRLQQAGLIACRLTSFPAPMEIRTSAASILNAPANTRMPVQYILAIDDPGRLSSTTACVCQRTSGQVPGKIADSSQISEAALHDRDISFRLQTPPKQSRGWPVLRSLQGYRPSFLAHDLVAGLTLVAIAIPEQLATSRLGGFSPQIGFFAFLAGSLAFALFGSNRFLSSGADSTITPIFAGGLALLATSGSPDYVALAGALALMVGLVLVHRRHFPARLDRRPALDSGDRRISGRHLRAHPDLATAGDPRAADAQRRDAAAAGDAGRTIAAGQSLHALHRSWRAGAGHDFRTHRRPHSRRADRVDRGRRRGDIPGPRKPRRRGARRYPGSAAASSPFRTSRSPDGCNWCRSR